MRSKTATTPSAVIEAHERRRLAPDGDETVEGGDDVVGVDAAVDVGGEGLAGELVDDVQQLQGLAVGGDIELEVHRPQRVGANR